MSIALWIGLGLFVLAFVLIKRSGGLSEQEAKTALQKGAVILDVRGPDECAGGMVAGAVNIPLSSVVEGVRKRYPDTDTVFLCHCASGIRSASAAKQLKAAGYAKAYNLGSYGRAVKVANSP